MLVQLRALTGKKPYVRIVTCIGGGIVRLVFWCIVDEPEWKRYINQHDNEPWLWHRKSGWWFWERSGRGGHPQCEEQDSRVDIRPMD